MRMLRCVRLLPSFKSKSFISRQLPITNMLIDANKVNNIVNNYVTLTTNLVTIKSISKYFCCNKRLFSSTDFELVDKITFERVCDETLESLCEYFEELVESCPHLKSADVTYASGVLTVNFGYPYGTYVINRQSPNRQIWLSSPTTGPKRYDFVTDDQYWIYKHDNISLHQLLQNEIKDIVRTPVDFSKCAYSLVEKKSI